MALSSKKKNKSKGKVATDTLSEFIPYACHYDANTMLTKNGELMQTIKIVGFEFESISHSEGEITEIRDCIRDSIRESLTDDNFAVWIHTIRRKHDLSSEENKYPNTFSKNLNDKWNQKNKWKDQYINELYITILIEGENLKISNPYELVRSLLPKSEQNHHSNALEKNHIELTEAVDNVLEKIEDYGAVKLGIYKNNGIYYSEMLSFLGKILNLREVPIPLCDSDIANYLPTHAIDFGTNTIKVTGKTGRHFASIVSVKEYHEISTEAIDRFLQLPEEFIITETFDYIDFREVAGHFKSRYHLQKIPDDQELMQISGISKFMEHLDETQTAYGKHQISIMILEDSSKKLNEKTTIIINELFNLGIVIIREDLMIEQLYWSQFPGNFEFLKRLSPVETRHIGGYASLYNFPAGKMHDNHWGGAITVVNSANNTPYFFNFHYEDNGHSFIIGPYGQGKTVLMNFLISESQKFSPRMLYFDHNCTSQIFIQALGGNYKALHPDDPDDSICINPFSLDDSAKNREFLRNFIEYLITEGNPEIKAKYISDIEFNNIKNAVDYAYKLPFSERVLGNIIEHIWPSNQTIAGGDSISTILSKWHGGGKYAFLFDTKQTNLDLMNNKINAIDVTDILDNSCINTPFIYIMLHMFENSLDGKPAILVLDEAWNLLDGYAFRNHMEDWLDRLREKNCIAIFATESVKKAEEGEFTKTLSEYIKTKIFLANPDATPEGYAKIFGLSDEEFSMLSQIDSKKRQFLLKHNVDAIIAELSLDGFTSEMAILSANAEDINNMKQAIITSGNDYKEWMAEFKNKYN